LGAGNTLAGSAEEEEEVEEEDVEDEVEVESSSARAALIVVNNTTAPIGAHRVVQVRSILSSFTLRLQPQLCGRHRTRAKIAATSNLNSITSGENSHRLCAATNYFRLPMISSVESIGASLPDWISRRQLDRRKMKLKR
jgi:hypothetical protein